MVISTQGDYVANARKAFRRIVTAAGLDPDEIVRHTKITHLIQPRVDKLDGRLK